MKTSNSLQRAYWVDRPGDPILNSVLVEVTPKVARIPAENQLQGIFLPGRVYVVSLEDGLVWFGMIEAWEAHIEKQRTGPSVNLFEIAERAFADFKAKRESDFDGEDG